jgi:dihydrofolate reductase
MAGITMIAAVGENNALGKDNKLLWHLPDDFRRFKKLTMGHPMIMGRKTFESFPKPLPGRTHIIITHNTNYEVRFGECHVVHSLEEALALVRTNGPAYIIGGGEIYTQGMAVADTLEITRVHASFNADAFFPPIDPSAWDLLSEEYHEQDARHAYPFTYRTYVRNAHSERK